MERERQYKERENNKLRDRKKEGNIYLKRDRVKKRRRERRIEI